MSKYKIIQRTMMNNIMELFYVDIFFYPLPYPNAVLDNLCWWKRPLDYNK